MCWFYADAILEEPVRKRKVKHRSKVLSIFFYDST
jgi:hypothetical protein